MPTLLEQYRHQLSRSPAPAEARSWERSPHVLSADLIQAGLDEVEVLVKYQLPLTSKRADVVLCGTHPRTGADSYVVVEFKQWSQATVLDGTPDVCIVEGYGGERLHPAEQVRRYCGHLADFVASLADHQEALGGVAYLHNATDHGVADLFELPEDDWGRLFTGWRRAEFLLYLQSRLEFGERGGCGGHAARQRCPPESSAAGSGRRRGAASRAVQAAGRAANRVQPGHAGG
jgi:hypothetical protein